MDDIEARYLIDQYGKICSWRMSETRLLSSQWSVMLAAVAIVLAIASLSWRSAPLDIMTTLVIPYAMVAMVVLIIEEYIREHRQNLKERNDDANKLLALEDHRAKYRKLPNTVTLAKICDAKYKLEELKKLLKESEPDGAAPPRL